MSASTQRSAVVGVHLCDIRAAVDRPSRRNSEFDDSNAARGRRTARLSSMASPMPTGTIEAATAIQRLDRRRRDKNTEEIRSVVVPFPRITRLAKSAHELECDRRSALRFCRHRNQRMKPDHSIPARQTPTTRPT